MLPGYGPNGATVISWGQKYTMTWEFVAKYLGEVYAIADNSWVEFTGATPALCVSSKPNRARAASFMQPVSPVRFVSQLIERQVLCVKLKLIVSSETIS